MICKDFPVSACHSYNASNAVFECIKGTYSWHRIWLEGNRCRRQLSGILKRQQGFMMKIKINMDVKTG